MIPKDADQKRREFEDKVNADRQKLEQQIEALAALPEPLADLEWHYHASKLYGRQASMRCKQSYAESLRQGRDATLADVLTLADRTARVPQVLYRDSCVGVRDLAFVDAMPETQTQVATILHIAPFWVDVDPAEHSRDITLHLPGVLAGQVVDFQFTWGLHSKIGRAFGVSRVEYERSGRDQRPVSVRRNDFTIENNLVVFGNCSARQIRYASGSRETPGRHLFYWEVGNTDEPSATIYELCKAWQELEGRITHREQRG